MSTTRPTTNDGEFTGPYVSRLLVLVDHAGGIRFPVDTEAEVSILPPSATARKNRQEYSLHAANNSAIVTFGESLLQLDLGLRHSFPWVFTIADTRYSILGVDFLFHFNLFVDVKHRRLLDASTQLTQHLRSQWVQPFTSLSMPTNNQWPSLKH